EGCSKEALRALATNRNDASRSEVPVRQPGSARIPTRLRYPSPALPAGDIGPLRGPARLRGTQGDDRKGELLQTPTIRLELLTNQRDQLDNAQSLPPRTEVNNLLTMLSALVRGGAIDRFSYMLLDPMTIQSQTFHYKAFDDKSGWRYDNHEYLASLRKLASSLDKAEHPAVTFQPSKGLPVSMM